jgi:hypothetical protein
MSENLENLLWGCFSVAAGAAILYNLEAIVHFDQNSGVRLKAWLGKMLGKSALNRDLWSVGTKAGIRGSRVGFRIVAVTLIVVGVAFIGFSFRTHFH